MRKVPAKLIQWLEKELPVLETDGVVSSETAGRLKNYNAENTESGTHWVVVAFAVLGSLLIGSGIILLFAHNWEDLSRTGLRMERRCTGNLWPGGGLLVVDSSGCWKTGLPCSESAARPLHPVKFLRYVICVNHQYWNYI